MLSQDTVRYNCLCWNSVAYGGATLNENWVSVSYVVYTELSVSVTLVTRVKCSGGIEYTRGIF